MTNKQYHPLSKLKLNPNNPRIASTEDLERLEGSLKQDGVLGPLLVKPDGTVIGGNQRLTVLQKLAKEKPLHDLVFPTNKLEVWVEIRDPKSKAEELRLIIKHNEDYGVWKEDALKEAIELAGKGFNKSLHKISLGPMVNLKDFMKLENTMFPEDQGEDENQEKCDACGQKIKQKKNV